jgi:lipopolysaccharide export system protein LptA
VTSPAPHLPPSPSPHPAGWRRAAAAAALVAALAAAPGAIAERADRDKPINYSADVGDVNYQTKVGTLTGSVIITQGTLTIHADRIVFKQNPDNSLSATAYGNPVSFRQKRDGLDEYFEGFAQRAEYDGAKELLELFDRALLKRGSDEIRSNYISYNSGTELFKAEGRETKGAAPEPGGARVRGVFQPKSDALPGKGTKDAGKGAPKAPAAEAAAVTLKPAGELAVPGK